MFSQITFRKPVLFSLLAIVLLVPSFGGGASGETVRELVRDDIIAPREITRRTGEMVANVTASLSRTAEMLEKAREERDMIRLNCLNEKLTPMRGLLKVIEATEHNMNNAFSNGDTRSGQHEFNKIQVAYERLNAMVSEAYECAGESILYLGMTRLDYSVDGELEESDATSIPNPLPRLDHNPPAASPFQ